MFALLEVMDKEFSFLTVLLWTLGPAVLAFLAAWKKPWLLVLILSVTVLFTYAQLSEVTDPFVGPAMRHEAGPSYILLSWCSPFIVLANAVAGLYVRRRFPTRPNPSFNPDAASASHRPILPRRHGSAG